jgi:hypothetical protein
MHDARRSEEARIAALTQRPRSRASWNSARKRAASVAIEGRFTLTNGVCAAEARTQCAPA